MLNADDGRTRYRCSRCSNTPPPNGNRCRRADLPGARMSVPRAEIPSFGESMQEMLLGRKGIELHDASSAVLKMAAATQGRTLRRPSTLSGQLAVPGDKSISHRSLILNALAEGRALVRGLSPRRRRAFHHGLPPRHGCSHRPGESPGEYTIEGRSASLEEPADVLDAGNSGTSMRLSPAFWHPSPSSLS